MNVLNVECFGSCDVIPASKFHRHDRKNVFELFVEKSLTPTRLNAMRVQYTKNHDHPIC